MNEIYDKKIKKVITTPEEIKDFLDALEKLCRAHNISISHEDTQGGFVLEKYDKKNIEWVRNAIKNY
jgi:predicted Zn-dependent peptidase